MKGCSLHPEARTLDIFYKQRSLVQLLKSFTEGVLVTARCSSNNSYDAVQPL